MKTRSHHLLETYYEGSPESKLQTARDLYQHHAHTLLQRPDIRQELTRFHQLQAALSRHMESMDLGPLCSRCAAQGGGCCSAYMADNTDSIQILLNLFLKADISCQQEDPQSCCFLGPRGCQFPAKPIFCLNYNCQAIMLAATPTAMDLLSHLTGEVLSQQTRMELLLLDFLHAQT